MRISDWSSDVCSSDLRTQEAVRAGMTTADRSPTKPKSVPKSARSAPSTTARLAAAQALYEMEVSGKSGHEVVPDFVDRRFAGLIEGGDMAPGVPHSIGRASCRARAWQSVSISGVARRLKTTTCKRRHYE